MGYQQRGGSPRNSGRGHGIPQHEKAKAKKLKHHSHGFSTPEQSQIPSSEEIVNRTLNALNHLGNQRFILSPFSEQLNLWLKSLKNVLSEFESNPGIVVDDQFAKERSQIISNIELELAKRRYKEVLSYLIGVRDQIRPKMNELKPGSIEYRVLDARQKAVKIITNASYGYAGWIGARWYVKPVAEAAAAWGRHTILTAIEMAKKEELKVVYGDTDSIFLENQPGKIVKLSEEIKRMIGLEVKPGEIYVRIFFTEAKKRYAGLLLDGRLDIVGMEVVRGDWATIAKNVQERVLEIILKEQSPKKALDFVQEFIYDLRQKRVPYRDLVIWKTLTKPAEEYEVKASHVEAAKMLKAKGWALAIGDKIGFVVVRGTGRLYERVQP
jgi:DNA polymerase elongation subunit (family B)